MPKNRSVEMITICENPFSKLDNAEIETTSGFVNLFSDYVLGSCIELFRPGNVIISGIEGSGKSMLLSLLKPEIRIAYYEKSISFPVHDKFLGAGINFTRSNLMDIGARIVSRIEFGEHRKKEAPLFFGDFINFWIVRDILTSIRTFEQKSCPIAPKASSLLELVGLDCSEDKKTAFVKLLSSSPTWSGYLTEVCCFETLMQKLSERIHVYRDIVTQSYPKPFPKDLHESLTEIGEPISQTVSALYKSGMLQEDVPVLIRLDQYEDLYDAVDFDERIAESYRSVVNKFLWTRDPNVSFKIGSRPYALSENLLVFGLGHQELEPERHFQRLDLDDKLRRKEDRSSWLFPKFAEDVFTRRLENAKYNGSTLLNFFGSTMSPHIKAQMTVKRSSRERALGSLTGISPQQAEFLIALATGYTLHCDESSRSNEPDGDLLSAKLGIAWILQEKEFIPSTIKDTTVLPWNASLKKWWKKERINQALLQISSNSGQRTNWSGKQDILTLSSNNILIFLNICREIWDIWYQANMVNDKLEVDFNSKPIISPRYQSAGIYSASSKWYAKIVSRPKGDSRKKLINKFSRELSNKLKEDRAMSYPGHNGFSLAISDFECSNLNHVLKGAVRYGDLIELPHTPKNKSQERRRKWYIIPILSPILGLPASHTKEPYYINISKLEEWIKDSYLE